MFNVSWCSAHLLAINKGSRRIDLPADPINGQAVGSLQVLPDDGLDSSTIHADSHDLLQLDVDEVELLIDEIVVESDHIVQALSDDAVVLAVDRQATQIITIAEYQKRLHLCSIDKAVEI